LPTPLASANLKVKGGAMLLEVFANGAAIVTVLFLARWGYR
jgi:hypothetical protein